MSSLRPQDRKSLCRFTPRRISTHPRNPIRSVQCASRRPAQQTTWDRFTHS